MREQTEGRFAETVRLVEDLHEFGFERVCTALFADPLLAPISRASSLPDTRPPGAPTALAATIWRERLEYLRVQEAVCSDPAQRFTLKKQIEEAEAKLRERS